MAKLTKSPKKKTKSSKRPPSPANELMRVLVTSVQTFEASIERLTRFVDSFPTPPRPSAEPSQARASSWFDHPPLGTQVVLPQAHTDDRGMIQNITHQAVEAVALITSKAGTRRASHWHKEDAHLCYVVKGAIEYFERPVGSTEEPKKYTFTEGQAFYTGPKAEHTMHFLEDTVFLTLGDRSRTQSDYEADLVRLSAPLG